MVLVGASFRTLGKHSLLNKILGREAGVMAVGRPSFIRKQYTILDLCAGDGKATKQSGTSSPEIIMKHASFMRGRGLSPDVFLFEKNANSFVDLKKKYGEVAYQMDSLTLKAVPGCKHMDSACFIHADPNLINDWPISENLLMSAPLYTTSLMTFGCNVGGIKRLSFEIRKGWFKIIADILKWLPGAHDALFVVLRGDKAQWAYLITGPKAWHDRGVYKKDAEKAFVGWGNGIDLAQYKEQKDDFFCTI